MSHALRVGVADQIGYFRAYNMDGSAKTDLTSSTTGLTLSVFRVGASAVSISSLSAKAADDTAHTDGAIRAVSGNLYTVDLPDAACADQVPSISVKGSYTGGVIEGPEHPLIGYNPASVAVGANTTTPPTVGAIADQVWDEARSGHVTAGTFGEKVNAELDSDVMADIADIKADSAAAAGYGADLVSKITSNVASVLAKLWYMVTGTGAASKFTTVALEDAPGSSGGLTTEQDQTLTGIGRAVDGLRGPAMNWNGNVGPGGVLQLTLGDDHETVIANDLPIRVKDPGGLLYAKLTAAGVSLQWGAGQATTGGMITGTVGTPTHDEETEITTVIVQVPNCAATGNVLAPYKWQLQRTISSKRSRMLQGSLNLNPDMIGA